MATQLYRAYDETIQTHEVEFSAYGMGAPWARKSRVVEDFRFKLAAQDLSPFLGQTPPYSFETEGDWGGERRIDLVILPKSQNATPTAILCEFKSVYNAAEAYEADLEKLGRALSARPARGYFFVLVDEFANVKQAASTRLSRITKWRSKDEKYRAQPLLGKFTELVTCSKQYPTPNCLNCIVAGFEVVPV